MCGRYSLTTAPEAMREVFGFENLPNLAPRYNIAPTQDVAVVRRAANGTRELALLRWGLIPSWAKDTAIGARMINARAETVAEKPAFKSAFRSRRCLVPADGFYEWRKEAGGKQPFRIGFADGSPFAFAGLWERWTGPEDETDEAAEDGMDAGKSAETVESVTIITTDANDKLRPIHHRMPVILDAYDYAIWLDPDLGAEETSRLLRPHAPESMAFYRVGTRVNNARHDDPDCIAPQNGRPQA
jgi:putative SOS response-associated peptidase YedK